MKFNGHRVYPTEMFMSNFRGQRGLGNLFTCRNTLNELSWDPTNVDFMQPRRDELEAVKDNLIDNYGHSDHAMLQKIFPNWPNNVIEEWAVDFNNSFMLDFDVFYTAPTMETVLYVHVYGVTTVEWGEYQDQYRQALTMEKLRSNL